MKEIFLKIAEGLRAWRKIDYATDEQLNAIVYAEIADVWARHRGIPVRELKGFDPEFYELGASLEYVPGEEYTEKPDDRKLEEFMMPYFNCRDLKELRRMLKR